MSDYQVLFNIFVVPCMAAMGYFAKQALDDVKAIATEMNHLKLHIAQNYVPRDDFKEFTAEIKEMFNKVIDKLDNKADK